MKKKAGILFILVAGWMMASTQVQSPETFLGYKPGTQYTPHFKIINYFNHIAAAAPAIVKLQSYGQ
ncbi:MAG TPA: hypothetical protein PLL71_04855, partial [Agriterribacter sp.]|nr:hypothetical protein [Agriterribacter sp.]